MVTSKCRKIDAFELWCCRRLLRVPWTARRSNQSILKEISPEYSLEGLMLKLKLQQFGHLMGRTDSLEKNLMPGKVEGRRGSGQQRMRWWMASLTRWTWVWIGSGSWWWIGKPGILQPMGSQKSWTRLSDWTELISEAYPSHISGYFCSEAKGCWIMLCIKYGLKDCTGFP